MRNSFDSLTASTQASAAAFLASTSGLAMAASDLASTTQFTPDASITRKSGKYRCASAGPHRMKAESVV